MKHNPRLCLLLLYIVFGFFGENTALFAQNYRFFNPSSIYTYATWPNQPGQTIMDHAVRFDSTVVNGSDTMRFAFEIAEPDPDPWLTGCWYNFPFNHWLGHPVIESPNGRISFVTANQDTLVFRTNTALLQQWSVKLLGGGNTLRGAVTDHDTATVLGILDSVKTITLYAFDQFAVLIPHPWNGFQVKIAKNHGMVQGYEFKYFPDSTKVLTLHGIQDPTQSLGRNNITYEEIYDYEIGDEVHVVSAGYWFNGFNYFNYSRTRSIYTVVSKTVLANPDTVLYQFQRCQNVLFSDTSGVIESSVFDTIPFPDQFYNLSPSLKYLPYETREPSMFYHPMLLQHYGIYPLYHDGGYNDRTVKQVMVTLMADNQQGCVYELILAGGGGPPSEEYIQGVGGPFIYWADFLDSNYVQLQYFKKGAETWGNPFFCQDLLVATDKPVNLPALKVFPNPASGAVTFAFEGEIPAGFGDKLMIYNAMGQGFKPETIGSGSQLKVEVSGLRPGIYFYELDGGESGIQTGKLIIR